MEPRKSLDPNLSSALYVISLLHTYDQNYTHSLDHLSFILNPKNHDEEFSTEGVLLSIQNSSEPEALKHAAKKLFELYSLIVMQNPDLQTKCNLLLLKLKDEELTVKFASLLFGMFCNHSAIRGEGMNSEAVKTFYPRQGAPAWRKTVVQLQQHCFKKLKSELNALSDPNDRLHLLELARDEMHIFFWKEQYLMFHDATGTKKYRSWILDEINKLEQVLEPSKNAA